MDWEAIAAVVDNPDATPGQLLAAGEAMLEHWLRAHDIQPTDDRREGFRLLALHRQGAQADPSFNACRETCREIAWHYNLLKPGGPEESSAHKRLMMGLVANHLMLFIRGKMEVAGLGEFCCSSRPVRAMDHETQTKEARG
jgi:hypothetical protein